MLNFVYTLYIIQTTILRDYRHTLSRSKMNLCNERNEIHTYIHDLVLYICKDIMLHT